MSLDDKVSSYNAPSRAFYESHTHYRDSDPRGVAAVNREAPSSGSSCNLGRGPWDERRLSSVGPALGSEGHYADTTAAVALQDGSGQNGASKLDKTLARSAATTTTLSHNYLSISLHGAAVKQLGYRHTL